jgi:hypothetical protein
MWAVGSVMVVAVHPAGSSTMVVFASEAAAVASGIEGAAFAFALASTAGSSVVA